MFQKSAFGTNTSSFGAFNAGASTSSPFGGFKSTPATSAFGASASFGANTPTQPTAGGGLFGSTGTTSGLFGGTTPSTSTSAFGANTGSAFGFGQTNTSGGLFGGSNGTSGLFGANQQQNTAFGAKPAGFGFGSTTTTGTTGSLFGSTAPTSSLFGQQNTSIGGGGLFGNNAGAFGQQQQSGTAHAKYIPLVGTDVVVKSGTSHNINIKHLCITCMKEYENKSLEELRFEDYVAGRKGGAANAGMFGAFQAQPEAKPLFGGTTAFGQTATTSAPSVFGGPTLGTNTFGQTNTFAFGASTQPGTTNLFGANKPAFGATSTPGTSLFGTSTTQAPPAFGAPTNTFGFGANTQSTGLFSAKPPTSAFGTTAAPGAAGFGGFGANTGGGLFGPKAATTAAPAFGTAAPAFGALSGGFGANTSTSSGIFGTNNAFGQKPAQPAFGFGTTQPTGLGAPGGLNTSFQNKPTGSLFPTFSAPNTSMFNTGGQNTQPLNFGTGNTSLGGIGGGINFGGSTLGGSSLGGLGGFGAANNNTLNTSNLMGASATGNVHEQILTLAARPYGDSPLFKDLLPESSTRTEDVLKPTNPAAMKAVLDNSGYRVSSPDAARLKVQPRPADRHHDKKCLFDGLEESDASLEDKLCLKPSRKRLVLRPQQNRMNDNDGSHIDSHSNKSLESEDYQRRPSRDSMERTLVAPKTAEPSPSLSNGVDRPRKSTAEYEEHIRGINTDLEENSEKHSSWLGSSRLSWNNSKEKPVGSQSTPRLYPVLDKEPQNFSVTERRASWLTTKQLKKPVNVNPASAENSVRELCRDKIDDKENVDNLSVSEEENIVPVEEAPPHPTGVKLTRPGYYTIPTLDDMICYIRPDRSCVVPHLTIGRKNYGNVYYDCEIDVAGLDLDHLVHFLNKEVVVYPDDLNKPPVGRGLNRRAVVTLDRVWPRDKTEKRPITDPDRLTKMDYENKLRRVCDKHDTKFIEYRPQTGSWVFRVEHFSKYGLTDSDEDEEPVPPQVMQRQQRIQAGTQGAAPVPKPPLAASGLGGMNALVSDDTMFGYQQTTLNLLNGTSKGFDMDTNEDTDAPTLYPEPSRIFGVKSPTSELARLEHRSSHDVQLMKATLCSDPDMDDDVSVSTGDQRVPSATAYAPLFQVAAAPLSVHEDVEETNQIPQVEEIQMKPLMVRPETVILNYHRKVPPFKLTIAGQLEAACIADMAVCRARHSRLGFGPRHTVCYPTTHHSMANLPSVAELSQLGYYVMGRHEQDWSEPVVARLAIAGTDKRDKMHDVLTSHLESLLKHSTFVEGEEGACPQLMVVDEPKARLSLLKQYLEQSKRCSADTSSVFTVSGAYCHEVWKLCEALWAADLENNGMAGTDELSVVNRHVKLIEWLTSAVAASTDQDLAKPETAEPEDESDRHSSVVWRLLLGGRVAEACRAARAAGDLNMAALLAQASGDLQFQTMLKRQLWQWRECGAAPRVAARRLHALHLLAGDAAPSLGLAQVDWLRAFNATARYLTPQVPTLDRIIAKYESFFRLNDRDEDAELEPVDLTIIEDGGSTGMQYPLPPYQEHYDICVEYDSKKRRILDLRYELMRARATNTRPKLHPSSYTPDPLDYSLSFLLGTWLGNPSVESVTGAAEQLEARGAWHLAVQALMYHPDCRIRGGLVHRVISRNAPSRVESAEAREQVERVKSLRVPQNWLLMAQAHRAKYEHLHAVEAEHLVAAGQWNAAHKVLIEELLPQAVLADDLDSIAPLLEKMNEAAQRHEISEWENGGQALYHYLYVCKEIVALVGGAGVEALRARVYSACRALGALEARSPRASAARAEMCSRLLQLATAAGEPPGHLATLLKALKLPPDCRVAAQNKITTELAEQASESCIEIATGSPMSSLNRT